MPATHRSQIRTEAQILRGPAQLRARTFKCRPVDSDGNPHQIHLWRVSEGTVARTVSKHLGFVPELPCLVHEPYLTRDVTHVDVYGPMGAPLHVTFLRHCADWGIAWTESPHAWEAGYELLARPRVCEMRAGHRTGHLPCRNFGLLRMRAPGYRRAYVMCNICLEREYIRPQQILRVAIKGLR